MTTKRFYYLYNTLRVYSIGYWLLTFGSLAIGFSWPLSDFAITSFFCLVIGVTFVEAWMLSDIKLIRKWRRLVNSDFKTFPKTATERKMVRKFGQVILNRCAKETQDFFRVRDSYQEELRSAENASCYLIDLSEHRTHLADLGKKLRDANKAAAKQHADYLATWDLFKELKMLPESYGDPEAFRQDAIKVELV